MILKDINEFMINDQIMADKDTTRTKFLCPVP